MSLTTDARGERLKITRTSSPGELFPKPRVLRRSKEFLFAFNIHLKIYFWVEIFFFLKQILNVIYLGKEILGMIFEGFGLFNHFAINHGSVV